MATTLVDPRFQDLRDSLRIAADLIGPDTQNVDPEYTRAISEFACMTSGISTEYKEIFATLTNELAQTTDPEGNASALANDLEVSAVLIEPDSDIASRPDYTRALAEHACFAADISGHHADSVHDLLVGILTND